MEQSRNVSASETQPAKAETTRPVTVEHSPAFLARLALQTALDRRDR